MTTPRDPGRPLRGGSSPRAGGPSDPDAAGGPPPEARWTPEGRYVVERHPPDRKLYDPPASAPSDQWEPEPRRRRPLWASAGLAALLAALLLLLVAVAILLPGLGGAGPTGSPSPSASLAPSVAVATATPTASPTPTAEPSPTPLPSVIEVEVQPGDSLTSIATRYDTKARSIAFWNRDRYPTLDPESEDYNPDRIQVGWKLVVHPGQTFPEPSPSGAPPATAPASGPPSSAPSAGGASAAPGG